MEFSPAIPSSEVLPQICRSLSAIWLMIKALLLKMTCQSKVCNVVLLNGHTIRALHLKVYFSEELTFEIRLQHHYTTNVEKKVYSDVLGNCLFPRWFPRWFPE